MMLCRLIRDELKLTGLLHTLQQYFFMGAGDWADGLINALDRSASQHGRLYQHSVHSMLDASFKGSSMENDADAKRLKLLLQQPPAQSAAVHRHRALYASNSEQPSPSRADVTSALRRRGIAQHGGSRRDAAAGVKVDPEQLRAYDAVQLTYDVAWPLSLVVTQASTLLQQCIAELDVDLCA